MKYAAAEPAPDETVPSAHRIVTTKNRNHVWHVEVTVAPTNAGF